MKKKRWTMKSSTSTHQIGHGSDHTTAGFNDAAKYGDQQAAATATSTTGVNNQDTGATG